jgi:hypothetical protein
MTLPVPKVSGRRKNICFGVVPGLGADMQTFQFVYLLKVLSHFEEIIFPYKRSKSPSLRLAEMARFQWRQGSDSCMDFHGANQRTPGRQHEELRYAKKNLQG